MYRTENAKNGTKVRLFIKPVFTPKHFARYFEVKGGLLMPDDKKLYFNASALPAPSYEYVCWYDVMGTKSHLTQSHKKAANFFVKIHLAALLASQNMENVRLYPVMDGLYVTAQSQQAILSFSHHFMMILINNFCAESENKYRFLVRGSLAFGPVTHGDQITTTCTREMNENYRCSLLLGMPVIQSYISEKGASPFGVFIHESARAFSPENTSPLSGIWYRWWREEDQKQIKDLTNCIVEYFDWSEKNSLEFEYPIDDLRRHRDIALSYFNIQSDLEASK